MKRILFFLVLVAPVVAFSAHAANTDDIVAMVQKQAGDDVILKVIEQSPTGFNLSAPQIVKLKEAKVPDKVIAAMIRHQPAVSTAVAAQPGEIAPAAPLVVVPPAVVQQNREAGQNDGTLSIENLDGRAWAYRYEPEIQTLWITPATNDRGNIAAHGGINLRMKEGTYKIRYTGQQDGQSVTVYGGDKSLIMLSRVSTAEIEALYVSVFERGERKATGRLTVLQDKNSPRSGAANVPAPTGPAFVEAPPTVVYRDSYYPPTVIYTPSYPVYSYGYPYYSYGYPAVGFGYSNYGHRGSFGFGVGFRH